MLRSGLWEMVSGIEDCRYSRSYSWPRERAGLEAELNCRGGLIRRLIFFISRVSYHPEKGDSSLPPAIEK